MVNFPFYKVGSVRHFHHKCKSIDKLWVSDKLNIIFKIVKIDFKRCTGNNSKCN